MGGERRDFEADYTKRFHGAEFARNLQGHIVPPPPDAGRPTINETSQYIAKYMAETRTELKTELSNDTYGIQVAAIKDYFQELQLPQRDFIMMWPGQIANYNAIMERRGLGSYPPDHHELYQPTLQLAIVVRSGSLEAQYGDIVSESFLVHELAHGSSEWNEWGIEVKSPDSRSLTPRRNGHTIIGDDKRYHNFIEEAFAAKVAADYVRRQGAHLDYQVYADPPGAALQEFCSADPRVFPAMLQARSRVEGLREVAKLFNELKPGLYDKLRHTSYTKDAFATEAETLRQAVHDRYRTAPGKFAA